MSAFLTSLGQQLTASGTTGTLITSGTVPAGRTIVCGIGDFRTSFIIGSTVADSAGNNYSLIGGASPAGDATNGLGSLWYCYNCLSLPSGGVITFTNANGSGETIVSAAYDTGIIPASDPKSGVISANGTSSSPTVTLGSRSTSFEMAVGWAMTNGAGAPFIQESGWADQPVHSSAGLVMGGNRINPGNGAMTYAPALSGSAPWAVVLVSFLTVQSSFIAMPAVIP